MSGNAVHCPLLLCGTEALNIFLTAALLLVQAGFGESLAKMVLGTCALWLPCLPLFWFMRKALNNKTNTK